MAGPHTPRLREDAARTRHAWRPRSGAATVGRCYRAAREARHGPMVSPSLRASGSSLDSRPHDQLNTVQLHHRERRARRPTAGSNSRYRAPHEDRLVGTGVRKVAWAHGDTVGGSLQRPVLPGFPWVLRPASTAARRALPPWTSIMVAPAAGLSRSLAPSPSLRSVTAPTVRRDAPPRSNRGRGCRLPSRRRTTQPAGRLGCGDACSPFRVGEGPGLRPAAIPGPAPITHGNPG